MKKLLILLLTCISLIGYSQKDRLSSKFHKSRRSLLRNMMPDNSVAVFFSNPIRNRANDVNYVYHQDPNFYYLTGLTEPNAVLLVFSDSYKGNNEILYLKDKDPKYELWNGELLGVKNAKKQLKIPTKAISDFVENPIAFYEFSQVFVTAFENDVRDDKQNPYDTFDLIELFKKNARYHWRSLSSQQKQLYQAIGKTPYSNKHYITNFIKKALVYYPSLASDEVVKAYQSIQSKQDYENLVVKTTEKLAKKSIVDTFFLTETLAQLRELKTTEELALITKAVAISVIAQIEVMKAVQPHMSEREIQGIHEFVYKRYGVACPGYPSIVGAGANGCILHYIDNHKTSLDKNELVLMDLGAEVGGYSADVTRTIPVGGKFTAAQKAIYNIVLDAQTQGIKEAQIGNPFMSPHRKAQEVINQGLADLGIISSAEAKHSYFPHGTSHYLGLDVHDPGTGTELKENSVITVEPGIYIPKGSPCDSKWWGIAIRIEDDILISKQGPVNLSKKAPKTVEAIEQMMALPSALDAWVLPELK